MSVQHPIKSQSARTSTNADAFLVAPIAVGVADGVSSVELEGFDPSRLPMELLRRCAYLCELHHHDPAKFEEDTQIEFLDALLPYKSEDSVNHLLSRASSHCEEMGSTTCCLAMLDCAKLIVRTINIGDSQMLLLRRTESPPKSIRQVMCQAEETKRRREDPPAQDTRSASSKSMDASSSGEEEDILPKREAGTRPSQASRRRFSLENLMGGYQIVGRSYPQQHFFNCPFQITRMPDVDCDREEVLRRAVTACDISSFGVRPGDIVVVGSDGIFDNLFDEDIAEVVNETCWQSSRNTPHNIPTTAPQVLVEKLIQRAIEAATPLASGRTPFSMTPFSVAAKLELGRELEGGKPDDTTVVVGFVETEHATLGCPNLAAYDANIDTSVKEFLVTPRGLR